MAVSCWGVGSICRTGSMISSDWVRGDPVEYRVRAALTLVEERQIVSRMEDTLDRDMLGL